MSTPVKWHGEFLVNTTTKLDQNESRITALADGRFVVTWADGSQTGDDSSGRAIRAQVFNANGSASGAEFVVNTITLGDQVTPTITALADGGFVVAWTGYDISGAGVRAQIFEGDGTKSGDEFLVNSVTHSDQWRPTITALAEGGFVVAWQDQSETAGDNSGFSVQARMFDANGLPLGPQFLVNSTTVGWQADPAIAALSDGRFVVSWNDYSQTGADRSSLAARAQLFNADGSKSGGEFLVNTTTTGGQSSPSFTALEDGRLVAVWTDGSQTGGDKSGYAIRAQVFDADGSKLGSEFLVNTTTAGDQVGSTVVVLADGRFLVAWDDFSQTGGDNSGWAIRAQVFDADGTRSGAEFLVNTIVHGNQFDRSIAVLADGRFVVTWTDWSVSNGDRSGAAIRSQIFDPREAAVDLSGTSLGDDFFGTRFADRMQGNSGDDNLVGWQGADALAGGDGNDVLRGRMGHDVLHGNSGNDILAGGRGNDILTGGAGSDLFSYLLINHGGDRINDFHGGGVAGGDRIDLSAIDAIAGGADDAFLFGGTTATAHGVWYALSPGKATLFVDTDGNAATAEMTIALIGVTSLIAGDFIL